MRAHADDLRAEVEDKELAAAVATGWRDAPLRQISERAGVLCEHAEKLTLSPSEITAADIEQLRVGGCDDATISDGTQVVALFAYFNRVCDGLGIDPEPEWEDEQEVE